MGAEYARARRAGPGFGELLRQHRLAAGLTQNALAERAGLSRRGLSDLERGAREQPYRDTIERLAEALALSNAQRDELLVAARRHGTGETAHPQSLAAHRAPTHNLPSSLSSFVGRVDEVAYLRRVLADNQLVTLTGPGGVGKTRLALEVAGGLEWDQIEEIALVELDELTDADGIVPVISSRVGVTQQQQRPLLDVLVESLKRRRLLLLLDNCEHLVTACARVSERLLRYCPTLRVLATSREPLNITGELVWPVHPLTVPDTSAIASAAKVGRCESAQLFVARAQLVRASFQLTDQNASAVAELCVRLDGIPLAIELAAARLRVLSVQEMVGRLDDCFQLLTGGSRTAAPRQQTLRATLDWSCALLSENESALFRRLSCFSGGWTLDAAEFICAGSPIETSDVLDLLSALENKSLLVAEEHANETTRYRLRDPVRQYAAERLDSAGERAITLQRHASYYVERVERIDELRKVDWPRWRREGWPWLSAESGNLRAILDRCRTGVVDPGASEATGLRLCASLFMFWWVHDRWKEAWDAYVTQLEASKSDVSPARFWCNWHAGIIASIAAEFDRSEPVLRKALILADALGDRQLIALAHGAIGLDRLLQGRLEEAQESNERGLALARQVGPDYYLPVFLFTAGWIALRQGRLGSAVPLLDESIAVGRRLGDEFSLSISLPLRGTASVLGNDLSNAWSFLLEAEVVSESLPFKGLGTPRIGLGRLALLERDTARAARYFRRALDYAVRVGRLVQICESLEGLALVAEARRDWRGATYLLGAVDSARRSLYRGRPPDYRRRVQAVLEQLRLSSGAVEFESAWTSGQKLSVDEAVAYAHELASTAT